MQNWQVTAHVEPISTQSKIQTDEQSLGIPIPEIYFGDNALQLIHPKVQLHFNALDALQMVSRHVKYKVFAQRTSEYKMATPYDWTYASLYRGTVHGNTNHRFVQEDQFLPLDKLAQQDPIRLFKHVVLMEDEYGDHGIMRMDVKIRVMDYGWFLLMRQFCRVDQVVYIQHETRVYHGFNSNEIRREFVRRTLPYEEMLEDISHVHNSNYKMQVPQEDWEEDYMVQEVITF